jgi:hypothetical protein
MKPELQQAPLSEEAAILVLIDLAQDSVDQCYAWGNDATADANSARLEEAKALILSRIGGL